MKKTRYLDNIDLRVSDRKRTQVLWKAAASTRFFLRSLERTMGNLLCGWRRQAGCVLRLHARPTSSAQWHATRFWAETREEVDRLARLVRKIVGKCLEGPEACRAYSRGYYACFFEDPDGNKLKICCREVRLFRVSGLHSPVLSCCLRSDREYLSSHRVFARITVAR
jgi:hypothetical protein